MNAGDTNGSRLTGRAGIVSALTRSCGKLPSSVWSSLFCATLLVPLLQLWRADLRVPFVYGGDAALFVSMAKALLQGEWIWSNSHLAAPFGFELWDLPISITLEAMVMKALSLFTRSPGLIVNLVWLFATVLTAGTMTWCVKRLGIDSRVAISIGVIYALQTYGFRQGIGHLHSLFYLVPFIATGALELVAGRLFTDASLTTASSGALRPGKFGRAVPRYLWLASLGMGLAYVYNAFFSCFLLLVAGVLAFITRRRIRELLLGVGMVLLICVVLVINLSPAFYHQAVRGKNFAADFKMPIEEETWGLEIHHLLTPIPDHPFAPLQRIYQISERAGFQKDMENTYSKLGIIGSVGFLYLLVFLLRSSIRGSVSGQGDESTLGACGALMVSCLLLATIGGFGSLFNVFVAPDVRCYARIVPFIDYFCLSAVAVLLMRLGDWWQRKGLSAGLFGAVLAALTIAAAADQAAVTRYLQYGSREQAYYRDATFVRAIESTLPRGASIFQLPYTPFPLQSGGYGRMVYYDQAKPYIHSTDLRWSWGAMAGRAADEWIRNTSSLPAPMRLHKLVHASFSGLWVDQFGYPNGTSPVAQLSGLLTSVPLRSADGRFLFFDLRPFAARVLEEEAAAREPELLAKHPIEVLPDGGFYEEERHEAQRWRWATKKATLILRNELGVSRSVKIRANLETRAPGKIRITGPGLEDTVAISGVRDYENEIALPARGQVRLTFSCDCRRANIPAESRSLYFRLNDFRVANYSAALEK